MPTRSIKLYSIGLLLGDFLTLLAAFSLAYIVRTQFDTRPLVNDVYAVDFFITSLTIIPFWIITFASLGLYRSTVYNKRLAEAGRLLIGSFIGILIVLGYAYVIDEPIFPARLVAVYALIGSFILLVFGREFLRLLRTALFRYGIGIRRVLLIGTSEAVRDLATQLDDTQHSGYRIVAIAGPKACLPRNFMGHHFSKVDTALTHLKQLRITTIVQTDLYDSAERNQKILSAAQNAHINYSFIPGEPEFYSGKNTVDVFLSYPVISVHQTPLIGWGVVVKRMFDVVASLLLLALLSPLFVVLIVLQKVLNPGPVFFKNRRLCRHAKPFGLYKFRSMNHKYSGQDAAKIFKKMGRDDLVREYEQHRKVKNDPRITAFGHFLRRTSLDELPQLFNVLRGDMSLVGPRPIFPEELPFYRTRGALLLSVKPGMTGLWQVSGRSGLTFEQRVELELYYAQNWSFWLDIKILFKTIPALMKRGSAL